MNPINRVGQKVLCVGDERAWLVFICPSLKQYPRKGLVYTVSGFSETIAHQPGIHLREVSDLECECMQIRNQPWLIRAFKPLDERQTDIGVFQGLLLTAPQKEVV